MYFGEGCDDLGSLLAAFLGELGTLLKLAVVVLEIPAPFIKELLAFAD